MQMDLWKILEKNMDQKQELRKRMKEKRDRISPQERRQKSAKICERLLSAPEYARFQKILVYAAIRSEVELQLFCDQALRDKKQIFFPKVCGKEMEFYRIENPGQLKKGMFSVPEPDVKQYPLSSFADAENGEAWILVPGVAFDEKGMRLGYGGGFYDRYLKQKENLHRTGIAFGEQIVKRIPTEIHDHPMDDVITEQQWYRPKRTTGGELQWMQNCRNCAGRHMKTGSGLECWIPIQKTEHSNWLRMRLWHMSRKF